MPQVKDQFSLLIGNLWQPDEIKIAKLREQYHNLPQAKITNTLRQHQICAPDVVAPEGIELPLKPPVVPADNRPQPVDTIRLSMANEGQLIATWDELEHTALNCRNCKLCEARIHVVIERGNRSAKWMFVGEGPGEHEDRQGRPFVGASGQLLDKMIQAMKLDPAMDVYIANVVKCRPPHNRNPEEEEIAACSNYLFSQINLVKPSIIITLGRLAAQTLLETDSAVGKLRNKVHFYQEIPLVVTYHPSYLLRTPGAKKDAWADLQLAMKTSTGI